MKTDLSAARARELLSYDPHTGALTWVRSGKPAGSLHPDRRIKVKVDQRAYWAHRLVWLVVHGAWPVGCIDHRNGDPSDNRLDNLRDTTAAVNMQNRRAAHCTNASARLGVRKRGESSFEARIKKSGKVYLLGTYRDAEAAHQAYVAAKRVLHEGCTL